jgi:hypothetical protein
MKAKRNRHEREVRTGDPVGIRSVWLRPSTESV